MTGDWSNEAGNSALHYRNKLHFKIYANKFFNILIKFLNNTVLLYFALNKYRLGEYKRLCIHKNIQQSNESTFMADKCT